MTNCLIIARGTRGDLFPFIRIAGALKARGHTVTFITHCRYENLVKQAGLEFVPLDNPEEWNLLIRDQSLLQHPKNFKLFYARHILPKIQNEYRIIREQSDSKETFLVCAHAALAAQISAERLAIPLIPVFLSPSIVANMPILWSLYTALSDDINRIRVEIGLPVVLKEEARLKYVYKRSIALWPEWFAAPERGWPSGLTMVGFILADETTTGNDLPKHIQKILESGIAPVLITGGTGTWALETEFYVIAVEACRLVNRQAILVTQRRELVPNRLSGSGEWIVYLSFAQLMPRLGAVIHHGGIGTSALALATGIPQLVLAAGLDRPDNAMRLEHLGVAEFLPFSKWQPKIAAEALHRILTSSLVRQLCAENSLRMHGAEPITLACEEIERIVREPSYDIRFTGSG